MKFNLGSPYLIKLRDHFVPNYDNPWTSISEIKEEDCIVNLIGFVFRENKNFVWVSMAVGDGDDLTKPDTTIGHSYSIAKSAIIDFWEIEVER